MIYGGNVKMAKSSNYRVKLRRRREGKTDYQARKALVTSRRPRLVTRASNKNVTAQIIIAKLHGDEVLAAANSRELVKNYGWMAPTGNIPAAYLTGYLCGLKAKSSGIEGAILDMGLVSPTKGAKVFAVLSGVVDAGVEIPHSEDKIVKERIKGDHISKYGKSLGAGSEEYQAKFSKYIEQGVAPEKIGEQLTKAKADIVASFKSGKQVIEAKPKVKAPALKEKAAPVEKVEVKPKAVAKAEPEPAAKEAVAPKAKVKAAPKAKASKAKAEPKAAAKTKAAPKEKAPKEKVTKAKAAPKEKAPKEKVTKKGEKKA
jgi:large subunit ribosomal protein L18